MPNKIRLSAEELEIAAIAGMTIIEYATQKQKIMKQREKRREYSRRYRLKKKLFKLVNKILGRPNG